MPDRYGIPYDNRYVFRDIFENDVPGKQIRKRIASDTLYLSIFIEDIL